MSERGYCVVLSEDFSVLQSLVLKNINFICIDMDFEDGIILAAFQRICAKYLGIDVPILLISTSVNSWDMSKWLNDEKSIKDTMSFIPSVSLIQLSDISIMSCPSFYKSPKFLNLCRLLGIAKHIENPECILPSDVEFGYSILSSCTELPSSVQVSKYLNFTFECFLNAELLKSIDPLPYFLRILLTIPGLGQYSNQLFMVLSELFSNALEHGVLELSSALKSTPEGFSKYFMERGSRLSRITSGYVMITINVEYQRQGGTATVTVEDSGKGYSSSLISDKISEENTPYNRGLYLVRQLCKELIVSPKGNKSKIIFNWTE
ncbi:ATP-binding protein [Marinomonas sp. 2405UD68-3]|uniref:ATP-binding protein n=1 Tax=Marinomonas sp. 2405UD68-3 TaxID=3391835 RepID=UPI0039C9154B